MINGDLRPRAIRDAIAEIDTTVVEKVSCGDVNNHGVGIGATGHNIGSPGTLAHSASAGATREWN